MEQFSRLSAAFEQQLVLSTARPGQRQGHSGDGRLEISVVLTAVAAATAALRKAALLAGNVRRSGWWRFNNETRLARRLRKAGHEVVVAEAE
ncbi:MAG: hypothetical protein JOZ22_04305 [Acidobacteriia bacterium]|nr:hypothetical protein [Terriglobia bacterium]